MEEKRKRRVRAMAYGLGMALLPIATIGVGILLAIPAIWLSDRINIFLAGLVVYGPLFLLVAFAGYKGIWADATEPKNVLEEKLKELTADLTTIQTTLGKVTTNIPELEAEVNLRAASIEKLQAETERLDRLAELKKVETAAIEEVIRTAQRASARPTLRRDLMFLAVGAILSLPLGLLVNFWYDEWIK